MKKLTENDVTPELLFKQRRKIISQFAILGITSMFPPIIHAQQYNRKELQYNEVLSTLAITPEKHILGYNNFYEFGMDKQDPEKNARNFKTSPWQISIEGEVENPMTLDFDDLLGRFSLEERIYRFRCVEAWSMVIPWIGFKLNKLLKIVKPTSKAKYVAFETLYDPEQMPGQKNYFLGGGIDYPYREGLTIEEASHPLTILSVGLYGKTLSPQNGAPIRLVVPWKYGFKSIKSIVKIRLTEQQPITTWSQLAPQEYGFYANVNPQVPHPRWSQATERVIGSGGLFNIKRQETLLFNGYDEVSQLYAHLDLKKYY